MTLYEAIFRRKSIRKYRDTEIDPKLLEKIEQYGEDAVGIRPEIRTKWKILKGSDKRLAGLFLVKAPYYVVLYSEICEDYRKNAGCLMEQLVLYLHTKGIGSCYQGGARVKHEDEKELEPVMIMAFGYPGSIQADGTESVCESPWKFWQSAAKTSGSSKGGSFRHEPATLAFCSDRWQNSYVCEEAGKDRLSDAAGF